MLRTPARCGAVAKLMRMEVMFAAPVLQLFPLLRAEPSKPFLRRLQSRRLMLPPLAGDAQPPQVRRRRERLLTGACNRAVVRGGRVALAGCNTWATTTIRTRSVAARSRRLPLPRE